LCQDVAQNFKEQGNEYFKSKHYREALGFYTQGVDAKPADVALEEALLCNRAACNLELSASSKIVPVAISDFWLTENYGSVLRDCSKALTLNSQSSKAFYRSGMALIALDRLEEALDCFDRCLSFDTNNKGVQTIRDQAATAKTEKDRKEREKLVRLRKEEEVKQKMNTAFKVTRHIASMRFRLNFRSV
jgi:small subunit ribosomal protein S7e